MTGQAAQVLQSLKMTGSPSMQPSGQILPPPQSQDAQGQQGQLPMAQGPVNQLGPVPNQYNFIQRVLLMPPVQNSPYMSGPMSSPMPGPMSSPMPMMYPMVPQMQQQMPQTAPQSSPQPAEGSPYPMPMQQPYTAPTQSPQPLQPLLPKPNASPSVSAEDEKMLRKLRKKARMLESELHSKMTECINHHDEQLKLNEILVRITGENQTLLAMIEKVEPELKPAAPAQQSPLTKSDIELYEMVAAGTHTC